MKNSWCTTVDKLMYWKAGSWTRYDSTMSMFTIRIIYDQLLITAHDKVLESFNMNCKMKGIYKGDVMILIVSTTFNEVRKVKFQIKENAAQCFRKLREHFTIVNHNSSSKKENLKYRNINDILKQVMEVHDSPSSTLEFPPNFEDFVKFCILDPTFPQAVHRTQKIINSITNN